MINIFFNFFSFKVILKYIYVKLENFKLFLQILYIKENY